MERNFQFSSAWARLTMRSTWIWPIKNREVVEITRDGWRVVKNYPYGSGEHAVCSRSPAQ